MDRYIKLSKYRKQLQFLDELSEVLTEYDDGNLFMDFTDEEENKYCDFIEFITDIQINVEKKLKKVEVGNYEN